MSVGIASLAISLAIVNLALNVAVLTVTVASKRLRADVVSRIISSLAISDIGFGTFIPFVCAMLTFTQTQPIPERLEMVLGTSYQIFGICSLLHLSFIAIVKCSVISKPLVCFSVFSNRVIAVTLMAIWFVSVVLGSIPAIAGAQFSFEPEVCLPTTVTYGVLQASIMATCFVLSATIVIVLYGKVFFVVRRQLSAILGVTPTGCVAGNMGIAGRNGQKRGAVSTSEMVLVDEVVPATRTVPAKVLSEVGKPAVKEGITRVGKLSMNVDPDGVHEDVATRQERKLVAIIEEENVPRGNTSGEIVDEAHAGAGHPLQDVQGDSHNNKAAESIKGERAAEDVVQKITEAMALRESAPVKAPAIKATHERSVLGKAKVKVVSFATGRTTERISQTSAFRQSIRSAKNLFIISGVYLITYVPALLSIMKLINVPPEIRPGLKIGGKWTQVSAATCNALLYIVLHRSVRVELVRLLCRRTTRSTDTELWTVSRTG